MLDVVNLSKTFKQVQAVKEVNMHLEQGEIVGLLGPNGAGKSTTISIISTLIKPTGGDVTLFGKSVLKHQTTIRKKLGIVPQEIALYLDLTAEENLQFFGKIYGLKGEILKHRIDDVLAWIGLTDRRKGVVKTFSGGMKRRLNIGVALLHEPEMIIMDEPTVGIDPQSRNYILETVKRLNKEKGMTVLYTSHYMEEVEYLCDRIYIMDQGKVIASGTNEQLKSILSSEQMIKIQTERFVDAFIENLKSDSAFTQVTFKGQTVTAIAPKDFPFFQRITGIAEETGTSLTSIEVKTPTLEDVFLHLTGRALRD
ncbi:ABC transporter ATP-binding protein [Fervidibacillus albus]|uniref:ABC transporter ATP-binding protein n=1 Tax=Fervidibacillus albus TaxID=2980026 RepID=A0A9E8LTM6_9BACI|nr:ABC transporter ATP-binding protein [Fervidibacillus albus]WAA08589.1 ABC transporter ATP-binding protein [Fervidibacillus albus]